jgi:hypothetical protein
MLQAQNIWEMVSEVIGVSVGRDFEYVASMWIRHKNCRFINVGNAVVLWSLWKTRNNMCFQDSRWPGTRKILETCACSIRRWCLLAQEAETLECWAAELE